MDKGSLKIPTELTLFYCYWPAFTTETQFSHMSIIFQPQSLYYFSLDYDFLLSLNGLEDWNAILHFLRPRQKYKTNLKWGKWQHINLVNHYWYNIQFYLYANIDFCLEINVSNTSQPRTWSINIISVNKYGWFLAKWYQWLYFSNI